VLWQYVVASLETMKRGSLWLGHADG